MNPYFDPALPMSASESELAQPANIESERAALGGLLLAPDLLPEIQSLVKPEDFFHPAHQVLFQVMIGLSERGRPLDIALIQDDLERAGKLDEVGGVAYIASLEQYVVTSAAAPDHARRVAEKARLRRLIRAAQSIIHEAATEQDPNGQSLDTPQILDRAEKAVFEIGQDTIEGDFSHTSDLVIEAMDHIEHLFHRKVEVSGLPSHYSDLDNYTSGLHPAELIILAARPSIGKTALALNIALQVAKGGKLHGPAAAEPRSVGIFSLEMSKPELILRLMSSLAKVSSRRVRSGRISHQELHQMSEASQQLGDMPLFIDDTAALTPTALRAKARRLKARAPDLGLIVIDYLQLMRASTDSSRHENRQQEVTEISHALKALAKELNLPVMALSQLSRSIEQRGGRGKPGRPMLSDLRESGSIEQDADVVLFIHRERTPTEKDESGQPRMQTLPEPVEIIIGKQRNGPVGEFPLVFIPEYTTFYDGMK